MLEFWDKKKPARIENGRVVWRDGRSARTSVLVLKEASAGMKDLEGPIRVEVKALYENQPFEAAGTVGRLFRLVDAAHFWPLDLVVKSGGIQASVSGTVKGPAGGGMDLACSVRGKSLAGIKRFFPDWPVPLKEDFSGSFRLSEPAEGLLRISDIGLTVGRSDLSGWAEIEFARGIALCRGLLLDTERTTIAGEGTIDLATEKIDIAMDPSPKGGIGFKGLGGLSLSLGELGNPFKLGGTLAAPRVALDSAGTILTLGKILGGFTLAGPFGLAAAFADFSSGEQNPCLKAIEERKAKAGGVKNP